MFWYLISYNFSTRVLKYQKNLSSIYVVFLFCQCFIKSSALLLVMFCTEYDDCSNVYCLQTKVTITISEVIYSSLMVLFDSLRVWQSVAYNVWLWVYECVRQGCSAEPVCRECNKRVYQMEKIVADQYVYHKTCFRCTHCNRVLRCVWVMCLSVYKWQY